MVVIYESSSENSKKLLSDYGVIFISIDDNEQADLKYYVIVYLCHQIFVDNLYGERKVEVDKRTDTL